MSGRVFYVVKDNEGNYLQTTGWRFSPEKRWRAEFTNVEYANCAADDLHIADDYKKVVKVTVKKKVKVKVKNDIEINKVILTKIANAAFPDNKWLDIDQDNDLSFVERYDKITTILKEYGLAPSDAYK